MRICDVSAKKIAHDSADRQGRFTLLVPDDGRGPFTVRATYTVRRGETVLDVARLVHRDIAESLKYARLFRGGNADGRQVGRDHPVEDGDVLELH